ncbi:MULTISPECIES: extensin family protein [unclassified Bradyrhizobium]|uniref:extensin family protein n=1 Tax=unclassified Bradyrhizobium TaxID=2631580 RepID=UPI001FF809FC|nr:MULTISPECIES: extensin family protein [unclassified Bradyrhizobium]MCK1709208.1 extensin family protein [Bradyrhizobium sp. 143]MCK1729079.1 extensin family protein [Bradyrhizobium sp. 142]
MSFSLPDFRRKWSCRGYMSAGAAMVTVGLGLLLVLPEPAAARKYAAPLDIFGLGAPRPRGKVHSAKIPLPKPRPEEAPNASDEPAPEAPAADGKPSPDKPAEAAPPPEKQASACRLALTEDIAIAPSIPEIRGPGGCGGEDLVRLEAIVLPDRRKVPVKPAAVLRCTMASAIADWVRTDMVPLATSLGSTIADLDNFDSFECRGRNRIAGAMLSEHGKANALDVRAIKLANGQSIGLTDRAMSRDVRERVLHSVCSRFTTVLGPGSDWYHEDHIHLDLAQRRNDYRICQWNVWDPLPQVAPLLPAERPEEAPPREVAAKPDGKEGVDDEATEKLRAPADKSAADGNKARPSKPATKKRR